MKVITLITCPLLTTLVEADLNQPLVPITALLLMVLVLAFLALECRR